MMSSGKTDFAIPPAPLMPEGQSPPGSIINHPHIEVTTLPKIAKTQSTSNTKLRGIGLHTNMTPDNKQVALPKMASEHHLMSSHTTPGLPVWQKGPKFVPFTGKK